MQLLPRANPRGTANMISTNLHIKSVDYGPAGWNCAVAASGQASLLQTWEFGAAKAAPPWRSVERLGLFDAGRQVGLAQIIITHLPLGLPGGLAWLNRGPLCCTPDGQTPDQPMAAMIEALADHYSRERGLYMRIAPPIETDGAVEPLRASPMYARTPNLGWASSRLDLTPDEEQLRARLRSNWRYSLRKMEKGGPTVRIGTDAAIFQQFIAAQRQFISRHNFASSLTPEFLEKLQSMLPDRDKMVALTAHNGDSLVGSILIAPYGPTCEYLAGNTVGSREAGSGVGHLLLWNAVVEMKRRGYKVFDLGGMDAVRTPKGIYDFKTGVNAQPYRFINELESVQNKPISALIRKFITLRRPAEKTPQ